MSEELKELLSTLKEELVRKTENLEETRLRLIEANTVIYEISRLMNDVHIPDTKYCIEEIIKQYLTKPK